MFVEAAIKSLKVLAGLYITPKLIVRVVIKLFPKWRQDE